MVAVEARMELLGCKIGVVGIRRADINLPFPSS